MDRYKKYFVPGQQNTAPKRAWCDLANYSLRQVVWAREALILTPRLSNSI